MAISFPSSPVIGQQYTIGKITWTWNGTSWDASYASTTGTTYLAGYAISTAGNTVSVVSATINTLVAATLSNYVGTITATAFAGDGSQLSNLQYTNIAGSLAGTTTNVTLIAGTYATTVTNTGTLTAPNIQNWVINGTYPNGNFVLNPQGVGDVILTTSTQFYVNDTATSISTTTGAIVVAGGVGIGGSLNAGNNTTQQQHQLLSSYQAAPSTSSIFTNAGLVVGGSGGNYLTFGQYPTGATLNSKSVQYGQWIQSGFSSGNTPYPIVLNPTGGDVVVGSNLYVYGTSSVVTPNRPAFRVYGAGTTNNLGTTQNGNGVLTGANYAVDYNQGGYLSTSTGVFTVPVAGLYQISLIARAAGNQINGTLQCVVARNYSTTNQIMVMIEWDKTTSVNHIGGSTIAKLAAGDTLVFRVTSGTINFDGNDNWSVAFLG